MGTTEPPGSARERGVSQAELPTVPLEKVLALPRAIWDNYAGRSAPPHELAVAVDISPTSSAWRVMTAASAAYGLTEGSYGAQAIRLTALGRRIVAPEEDGDAEKALAEAVKRPGVAKRFFERYDKKKLPQDTIGANVLTSFGVAKDKAATAFELVKQNARLAGLILDTKTGPFVVAEPTVVPSRSEISQDRDDLPDVSIVGEHSSDGVPRSAPLPVRTDSARSISNKVFISHGADRRVAEQLAKAIRIAKFEPIISVNRETTAKPVPDKVFDDMRSCFAGIIHVSQEGILKDEKGNEVVRINENVLIEIGAAIALYRKNLILLVEKSVNLPTNLQGLYRCEYGGGDLTAEALFKVLEAISLFEPGRSA
jgi:hypothetical protein